jgi:hypothetical protein
MPGRVIHSQMHMPLWYPFSDGCYIYINHVATLKVVPGQVLEMTANNKPLSVTVPLGAVPGQQITVTQPADMLFVPVPAGCGPGTQFDVIMEGGTVLSFSCTRGAIRIHNVAGVEARSYV